MSKLIKPEGYRAILNLKQTELAIKQIKDFFLRSLSTELRLRRVTAPLFVLRGLGLNDDLNGVERAVSFPIKDMGESVAEVVHSLAKWKRVTLAEYEVQPGYGIITDMNAIRADEELDNLHSLYVDQWDWELVIAKEDRTMDTLKDVVRSLFKVFKETEEHVHEIYPEVWCELPDEITFITSQELLDMYPDLTPKEREDAIVKEKKAVFLMQIGKTLSTGEKHDGRSPDYDDWDLNGDILFYNAVLDQAIELSSMGIRVNKDSLLYQIKEKGEEYKLDLPYHQDIINERLPLSIGGGIGQSRMCMFMLKKVHIGEVQASYWDEEDIEAFAQKGVHLL